LSRVGSFGTRGRNIPDMAAAATTGLIDAAQERALWSRFGL
jgi:hypothetical protein